MKNDSDTTTNKIGDNLLLFGDFLQFRTILFQFQLFIVLKLIGYA